MPNPQPKAFIVGLPTLDTSIIAAFVFAIDTAHAVDQVNDQLEKLKLPRDAKADDVVEVDSNNFGVHFV